MFLLNSRLGLFTAARLGSRREGVHLLRAVLIPKLRTHFAEFLSEVSLKRLRILSPPTCVGLRYGWLCDSLRGFSWQPGIHRFAGPMSPSSSGLDVWDGGTDLPMPPAYTLEPGRPSPGRLNLLRPLIAQTPQDQYRNIDLFPFDYALRPRLRNRLTLS